MSEIKDVRKRLNQAIKDYRGSSKFEGEPDATLYFYSCYMDGDGELRGPEQELYSVFDISPAEAKVLGLKGKGHFAFRESESGFVYGSAMNKKEYTRFDREISKIEESASEDY